MQTRLSRNLEKKTKRQLYINIIGTIIVLFLLLQFGVPLLIKFSLFVGGLKSSPSTTTTSTKGFVAPPVLTQSFTATNSATVSISGTSMAKTTVKLYINDAYLDQTVANDDGSFTFQNVSLTDGVNTLKAKAQKDQNISDFSDNITITMKNKQPSLNVDSPTDGQHFSKDDGTTIVKGKTDPDVKVTVNDFWAVSDSNGNFSYTLRLNGGDNKIVVVATDLAGNTTRKEFTVNRDQ